MLLIGIVLAPLGLPISQLLGHGRMVVSHWVLIFFLTLPLSLVGILLSSFLGGLSRWKLMAVSRLIPIVLPAGALIVLYFLNAVTVSRLALVAIVAGIASILPALIPLRHWRPLRVRRELIRAGVPFGLKSWASFIASLANGRLDQLLMTGLASSSQLGLYAVAVTFSLVPNVVSSAVAPPLLVRVAAGERHLVGDALRVCLAIVVLTNLVMAGIAVVLIPLAFGPDFGGAVPMAAILLLAAVPLSGTEVLGGSLVADGAPSIPSIGEYATLAVTVPGLVLLLPLLGGVGAALVSLVAYSANFTIQLAFARRRFECSLSTLLLPTMADVRWGLRLARAALHRIGAMPKMVKGNSHKPGL
jgi:O-antigen/teichoic acid export membrane protein